MHDKSADPNALPLGSKESVNHSIFATASVALQTVIANRRCKIADSHCAASPLANHECSASHQTHYFLTTLIYTKDDIPLTIVAVWVYLC
ncbi:hypothetical protein CEXT_673081 [Caerostris extrusa]|uniref:Uncharacterized protein n=1 Tax=Caerostris extrusa TaxID=172846 RepID=A0AAV4VXT0_CAEEX|nr:hypothetical protein CEXT_673081 [Caerostris extrusa]